MIIILISFVWIIDRHPSELFFGKIQTRRVIIEKGDN